MTDSFWQDAEETHPVAHGWYPTLVYVEEYGRVPTGGLWDGAWHTNRHGPVVAWAERLCEGEEAAQAVAYEHDPD